MEWPGRNPIVTHLFLDRFKSSECRELCQKARCLNYHSKKDRRRPQTQYCYSKTKCSREDCDDGCAQAHNQIEQKYHVLNYRKTYCPDQIVKAGGGCPFGESCSFANSDCELKILPLHLLPIDRDFMYFRFKSEFCPFLFFDHDTFACVYAHNWQDFKRPYRPSLRRELCELWDKNKKVYEYAQGCPNGFKCDYCHGWKEFEFHPDNYKDSVCKKCPKPFGTPSPNSKITLHVCSFLHDKERPAADECPPEFYRARKALHYGKMATSAYIREVTGAQSVSRALDHRPAPAETCDFLVVSDEDRQLKDKWKKPAFAPARRPRPAREEVLADRRGISDAITLFGRGSAAADKSLSNKKSRAGESEHGFSTRTQKKARPALQTPDEASKKFLRAPAAKGPDDFNSFSNFK